MLVNVEKRDDEVGIVGWLRSTVSDHDAVTCCDPTRSGPEIERFPNFQVRNSPLKLKNIFENIFEILLALCLDTQTRPKPSQLKGPGTNLPPGPPLKAANRNRSWAENKGTKETFTEYR